MTGREKFLKIARFELKNEVFIPSCYQWFWKDTIKRWKKEGLPEDVHIEEYFGFDRMEVLPINMGFIPPFEREIIKEDEKIRVVVDESGVTKMEFKENAEISMPHWIEFPLKTKEDFEKKIKPRLNPHSPARYPVWWEDKKRTLKERDYPLGISGGSLFGWLRNWIGLENFSLLFYDAPEFVHEMMEYLEYFIIETAKKAIKEVEIDFVSFWEDMAYKTASLISPGMFKEFMLPHYKKITKLFQDAGIDILFVDSDGYINELIPLFLEGGVNGFYPLEVSANVDAVELRKKYPQIILLGNIDKRVFSLGKKEIYEEVMKKVPYLIKTGGYFPAPDHSLPSDVPFENYQYYLNLIKSLTGKM